MTTAAVIVADLDAPKGYFGTNPTPCPRKFLEVKEVLQLYTDEPVDSDDDPEDGYVEPFLEFLTTADELFSLGAFERGFILSDSGLLGATYKPNFALLNKIITGFPQSAVLAFESQNSSNSYGYSLYERGILVRSLAGYLGEPQLCNVGELLPEEEPHFQRSKTVDGRLIFEAEILGQRHEFSLDAYGDRLIAAVCERFLGKDVWQDTITGLAMQKFRKLD